MAPPIVDVRRRAWKTLIQGLAVAVGSAALVTLLSVLGTATSWREFGGALVAFSFFQAVATAGVSWLVNTGINVLSGLDDIEIAGIDSPEEG